MLKLKLDKHRIEYMYAHTASSQFAAIIYAEKVKQRGAPLRTRWKFLSTCCGDARNNARCTQARKTTHGLDGQHQDVNGTLRGMTEDTDKWRKYVHGVASPRIEAVVKLLCHRWWISKIHSAQYYVDRSL